MTLGLSPAPALFTRVLRWPLSLLRSQGVHILAYLDDWILRALSSDTLREHVRWTCTTVSAGVEHQLAKVPPHSEYGFDLAGGTLAASARKVGITSRQGEGDYSVGNGSTHIQPCFPDEL